MSNLFLEYLISSRVRRKMLRQLWIDKQKTPVLRLANEAEVSFSAAYEELLAMEKAGLAISHVSGRTLLYEANLNHPASKLLEQLFKEYVVQKDINVEIGLLKKLELIGIPISLGLDHKTEETQIIVEEKLEDLIISALLLSHKYSALARVLPVFFFKNFNKIEFSKLLTLSKNCKLGNTLGFFLELTWILSGKHIYKELAKKIRDRRNKKVKSFFVNSSEGKYAKALELKNTPKLAKKWFFTMNMGMDAFESHFRRFTNEEI